MVLLILERVSPSLRGEVTRWMLELRAGVFAGTVSALVRDRLWEHACRKSKGGAAILVYNSDSEQGFDVRLWGLPSRRVVDIEGLRLVQIPK